MAYVGNTPFGPSCPSPTRVFAQVNTGFRSVRRSVGLAHDPTSQETPAREDAMKGNGWLGLILTVVVIAVIVAVVVMVGRQRKTKQAERADSLRSEASEQSRLVRQRERHQHHRRQGCRNAPLMRRY